MRKKRKKKKEPSIICLSACRPERSDQKKMYCFSNLEKKIAREHSIDEIDTTVSRSLNRVNLQLPLQNLRSWGGGGGEFKIKLFLRVKIKYMTLSKIKTATFMKQVSLLRQIKL